MGISGHLANPTNRLSALNVKTRAGTGLLKQRGLLMKIYSPGASVHGDYAYICDCCETDDGRATLVWHKLPKRKGHFVLCRECIRKLADGGANNG